MSVTLTGTGGLFKRLGLFGGLIQSILNNQGAQSLTAPAKSVGAAYSDLLAQFGSASAQADVFDDFFANVVTPYRAKPAALSQIKSYAQKLLIRQVNDDTGRTSTLATAWAELIRQMGSSAILDSKVSACTVAATTPTTVSGITNTGTAVVTSSKIGPILPGTTTGSNAMDLQFLIPETMRLTCTADAATGGATQYQESFQIAGQPATVTDPLAWNYTTIFGAGQGSGSGASLSTNACDAAVYQGAGVGGNLLYNGDFSHFTSHLPDHWVQVAGVAGTDFSDTGAGTAGLRGGQCLTFLATNTALKLTQQFGSGGGTTSTLLPNTVYAVNSWWKKDSNSTGILEVALVDGSDTIINDNNGVNNKIAIDLSTLDNTYTATNGPHWGYFRTPAVLPSVQKFRIRTTTAVQVAASYLSHVAMRPAKQVYTGGPFVDVFSGATASIAGDSYQAGFTNDFGNVATGKFNIQTLCNLLFDLRASGLIHLPIVGTTLVADSNIS